MRTSQEKMLYNKVDNSKTRPLDSWSRIKDKFSDAFAQESKRVKKAL
jgi:hypothetical protein